jgi:hypothetical protein
MRKISVPRTRHDEQGLCPGSGLPVSLTRSGTLQCPHCLREYRITKDGHLWRHQGPAPHWENRTTCHRRHHFHTRCLWCGAVKVRR